MPVKCSNKISKYLEKHDMNQEELANLVDVKREYINRIIHAKIQPTIGLAMRIAKTLDATVEELWFENN